jgi:hypothetical protein
MLWPFKEKKTQKITSIITLIIGVLIMIASPTILNIGNYKISSFILGMLITFIGIFYIIESQ